MPESAGLMRGKRGLILGVANNRSIAWGIAKSARAHGAELAFTYQGDALKKRVEPLAKEVDGLVVGHCDVTDPASIDAVFAATAAHWPTIDFVVHAIAFSDRAPARRPLHRHHPGQFHQHDADQLLLAHRGRPARREADDQRRRDGHAHLLRLREMDAALQRDGRRQGRRSKRRCAISRPISAPRTSASTPSPPARSRRSPPPASATSATSSTGTSTTHRCAATSPRTRSATPRSICSRTCRAGVTGEIHHVDAGYHIVGMKHPDAPDIIVGRD